jgi:aminoglycoside phosphotransferase family enzyme
VHHAGVQLAVRARLQDDFGAVPPPASLKQKETVLRPKPAIARADAPTLAEKVTFLSRPEAYGRKGEKVTTRETHMSCVFLVGDEVFKLKKPVRFPYLDFSTLAQREAACRAELAFNRRLAPDVYRDVIPLTLSAQGLALGGAGEVVDWLVVMRRLDEKETLENKILSHRLTIKELDRLAATLVAFYRHAKRIHLDPARHLAAWHDAITYNDEVLREPRFRLPMGLVRRIGRAQRLFLQKKSRLLEARLRGNWIRDCHGDLRPEHIFLGDQVHIIDGIEFNPQLRALDPLDEFAFLAMECDRLGAAFVSTHLRRKILPLFGDGSAPLLYCFYRCYRASLRARLSIAHLLEPHPATPQKWPLLARAYLELADKDAMRLERVLRSQPDRSAPN